MIADHRAFGTAGPTPEPADHEDAHTPSAAMRSGLRALADRRARDAQEAQDPEEQLWGRVLGLARPIVIPPGDRPAR